MENCILCNSNFKKKPFKSDHINSIGHQEKLNQYYCKNCKKIYICPYNVKIPI